MESTESRVSDSINISWSLRELSNELFLENAADSIQIDQDCVAT